MQATGVYWVALFEVLHSSGFQAQVVNAQYTKNLPGRKTEKDIGVLRCYLRQRENLVAGASTCVQHMQKALTQ